MSPNEPSKPPPRPPEPEEELTDFPDLPENTDLVELEMDLDPGAPEPIGELEHDEVDLLITDALEEIDLSDEEPEGTFIPSPIAQQPLHLIEDDLEDFATQEELPILPWRVPAELLEHGVRLMAVLEPTLEHSVWETPDPPDRRVEATVRIRMLDLATDLEVRRADTPLLRLGRDVIAGRLLIAVE